MPATSCATPAWLCPATMASTRPRGSCLASRKISASLSHDEDHDFWILNVATAAKTKTRATKVNLRFIAIGRTSE